MDYARAAAEIAGAAGALLLEIRAQLDAGDDPDAVRAEGDRRSHELILSLLEERFPDDPVLSEEAPDDRRRLGATRAWIVDPLDGTREFGEAGRTDWAVHVALVADGSLAAGAVALPAAGRTFASSTPPLAAPRGGQLLRLVVSRTRPASEALTLAERLEAELVPMGSAGAKAMAVVTGDADVYLHTGGQYVWDSAAPVAVAASAGLHTSRADGSPLVYDAESTWLPDLLICRPDLVAAVLEALAVSGGGTTQPASP
jgi:3'(2'), 5'-bisphosphate nucleotidase